MKFLLLALVAALAGCAHRSASQPHSYTDVADLPPKPEKSTPGEIDASRDLYRLCLVRKEPRYDDGVSDAATIATVLRTSCPAEYDNLAAAMMKGQEIPAAVAQGVANGTQSLALRIVLEERAKRIKR